MRGDVTNRRALGIGVAPDCQQQLVLSGCEARRCGLSLAPAQEPAQSGAQLKQRLVVGVLKVHIVLRYRHPIYQATRTDGRRTLVSAQTAYKTAPGDQAVRRISGVEQLLEIPRKLHVGRFSEGIEQLPEIRRKLHLGRFSEGIEQLPKKAGKPRAGRFSQGIEQLPEGAKRLRRGSFADRYEEVRQRGRRGRRQALMRDGRTS